MDKLSTYIQSERPVSFVKIAGIFGIISLILAGLIFYVATRFINRPEARAFIANIPVVEIRDGAVQSPTDTVWQASLPDTSAVLKIDTTTDTMSPSEDGLFLTRKQVILSWAGQATIYPLGTKNIRIDSAWIQQMLRNVLYQMAGTMALFILIALVLGLCMTYLGARLTLWVMRRAIANVHVWRAAIVGWFGTVILILILSVIGRGLSFAVAWLTATVIADFGLMYSERQK